MPKVFLTLVSLLLFAAGCELIEPELKSDSLIGLWSVDELSVVEESTTPPHNASYTVNYEDVGRIFFNAEGKAVLQVYVDRYPNFEILPVGVSTYEYTHTENTITMDELTGEISELNWSRLEFSVLEVTDERRERIIYRLKRE